MEKLNYRQQAILDYIKKYTLDKGYSPSIKEIGEAVGLASSSTVHGHLARLEKKGLIKRNPSSARAIEIIDEKKRCAIFAWGNDTDLYYMHDNGMIDERIAKGDTVIVRRGYVDDGDIALVSLYGRKMVRRIYRQGKEQLLEAESKTERSILTSEAKIIGKVVGVFRLFEDEVINM